MSCDDETRHFHLDPGDLNKRLTSVAPTSLWSVGHADKDPCSILESGLAMAKAASDLENLAVILMAVRKGYAGAPVALLRIH